MWMQAHVLYERLSSGGGKSALHSQSKGETWSRLEGNEPSRADERSSAPVGENELGRKVRHAGGMANGSARGDAAVSGRPVRSLRQILQQRREHEGKCDQWSREFGGHKAQIVKAHPSDPGPHQVRVRSDGRGGLPEMGLVAGWTSDVEGSQKSGRHHARVMHSPSLDSVSDGSSGSEEGELSSTGGSLARTGKLAIAPRFAELLKERGFSIANTVSATKADTVSSASRDGRGGKLDGCSPFASHGTSKNFARLASAQPSHIAQKILLQLLDSFR